MNPLVRLTSVSRGCEIQPCDEHKPCSATPLSPRLGNWPTKCTNNTVKRQETATNKHLKDKAGMGNHSHMEKPVWYPIPSLKNNTKIRLTPLSHQKLNCETERPNSTISLMFIAVVLKDIYPKKLFMNRAGLSGAADDSYLYLSHDAESQNNSIKLEAWGTEHEKSLHKCNIAWKFCHALNLSTALILDFNSFCIPFFVFITTPVDSPESRH